MAKKTKRTTAKRTQSTKDATMQDLAPIRRRVKALEVNVGDVMGRLQAMAADIASLRAQLSLGTNS